MTNSPGEIELVDRTSYDGGPEYGDIPDASGRSRLPCISSTESLVVVTLGQSNAANFAQGIHEAKEQVVNFNVYDGQCYHAVDPLLGATGLTGNFATRLGDILVSRGVAGRVVLAPIGVGNTRIEHWSFGGIFNRRILVLIRRLWENGITPDFILWQQGEGNSSDWDFGGRQYRRHLLEVVQTFRNYGVTATFMVAQCTISGAPHPNPLTRITREFWRRNIRAGQRKAAQSAMGTGLGPDTDRIGYEGRFDYCHMSESGAQRQAEMWADEIIRQIKPR